MGSYLEALSDEECVARLARHVVGRVSVTRDALPVVVPVNYVLDGRSIVFRTRRAGLLAGACDESIVAFEIDELAPDGSGGWSVLVVGIASLLRDSEHVRALSLGLVSAAGDDRDQFVRLRFGIVSGRRIDDDHFGAATGTGG